MRTLWDIPLLIATGETDSLLDAIKEAVTPPEITSSAEFRDVRAANREPLLRALPGYNVINNIYHLLEANVDF